MKVVFLGAYFNHHQKPLSEALAARSDYTYIATSRMPEMRAKLGYGMESEPEYVCHYDQEPDRAEKCLKNADVIITGSAPEKLVRQCVHRNQLVFRYAERPLKKGPQWHKYFPRLVKWHWQNPPGKPIYMLCASAYTAADYARFGLFRGKVFRWGYFPEVKEYTNMESLLEKKKEATILWAGRFLDWKHPDDAIRVAAKLKSDGYTFEMNLIGTGEMEAQLRDLIDAGGLDNCVHLLGTMKPEEVRHHMEQAEVFLFTSDRREGWGAVVNEAMNSGCAVVASDAAGSPPYLIRDGENGMLYHSGNVNGLYEKVKQLLDDADVRADFGRKAYETMIREWNGSAAAERILEMAEMMLNGTFQRSPYKSGPCSSAEE